MAAEEKKAPEVETVTMDDGRNVDFSGKQRIKKESGFDSATRTLWVRLDFRNGETRTFKTTDTELIVKAAAHGLEQKLGDETSGIQNIEDAVEAVDQLMMRLEKGAAGWLVGREGGSGMAGASVLCRALIKVTGQDVRVVREYLSNMDAKTKMALRGDPVVAQEIKRIEEERAANAAKRGKVQQTLDTASILASLKNAKAEQPA